eukprot:tig00020904_g15209.t1
MSSNKGQDRGGGNAPEHREAQQKRYSAKVDEASGRRMSESGPSSGGPPSGGPSKGGPGPLHGGTTLSDMLKDEAKKLAHPARTREFLQGYSRMMTIAWGSFGIAAALAYGGKLWLEARHEKEREAEAKAAAAGAAARE